MNMSMSVATRVETVKVSDKFQKELSKFFAWANKCAISIRDANTSMIKEWNADLLQNFEEPARNKLEIYIRDLLKFYVIIQNGEEVEDYKTLAKEYKNGSKVVKESESSDVVSTTDEKQKTKNTKNTKTTKTAKTTKTKESGELVLDANLNTEETFYVETLDFTTEQIMSKWNRPETTGTAETKHRYEWKFKMDEHVYSIYDWVFEDGSYDDLDDAEWFLAGDTDNKKQTKKVIDKLSSLFVENLVEKEFKKVSDDEEEKPKVKKTKTKKAVKKTIELESDLDSSSDDMISITKSMESIKVNEKQLDETPAQFSKEDMKEMFGSESEDDVSIDINLDDLE